MKLLYLYLSEAGPLHGCELNLDSDWLFSLRQEGDGFCHLDFKHKQRLPDGFWRDKEDKFPSVESISAIIGNNKAGKTSIAAALSNIYCDANIVRHVKLQGDFRKYIAVAMINGKVKLYANVPCQFSEGSLDAANNSIKALFSDTETGNLRSTQYDLTTSIGCVYYNPVVTTEFAMDIPNDIGSLFKDISATKAMADATNYRQYQVWQREKVFLFIHNMLNRHKEVYQELGMPLPYQASVVKRDGCDNGIVWALEEQAKLDERYSALSAMAHVQEIAVLFLLRFAFDSFAWGDMLIKKAADEQSQDINWLEEALLNLFVNLGYKMRMVPDSRMDALITNDERIRNIRETVEAIVNLAERVDSDESLIIRMPEDFSVENIKEQLRFFDVYIKCLETAGIKAAPDGLRFSMSNEGHISVILELLRADKHRHISLEYNPCLSAGEMSYFLAFASLYEYFNGNGMTNGDVSKKPPRSNILLLDEVESSLHPEMQRRLVWAFKTFLNNVFKDYTFHVIFETHSPQLLSDIPDGNVVFLRREDNASFVKLHKNAQETKTFGANIYDLYKWAFFLQGGPVGEFASKKLNNLLRQLASDANLLSTDINKRKLAELVGDPYISDYLKSLIAQNV